MTRADTERGCKRRNSPQEQAQTTWHRSATHQASSPRHAIDTLTAQELHRTLQL